MTLVIVFVLAGCGPKVMTVDIVEVQRITPSEYTIEGQYYEFNGVCLTKVGDMCILRQKLWHLDHRYIYEGHIVLVDRFEDGVSMGVSPMMMAFSIDTGDITGARTICKVEVTETFYDDTQEVSYNYSFCATD